MGFLIRMAFWFSLVLLVLPLDAGRDPDAPSVGPLQALAAAREAVFDVAGICERKPDVCVTGKAAMETIAVRARESARIAYELLGEDEQPAAQTVEAVIEAAEPLDGTLSTGSIAPTPRSAPIPTSNQ